MELFGGNICDMYLCVVIGHYFLQWLGESSLSITYLAYHDVIAKSNFNFPRVSLILAVKHWCHNFKIEFQKKIPTNIGVSSIKELIPYI